jgi:hypothetical protein
MTVDYTFCKGINLSKGLGVSKVINQIFDPNIQNDPNFDRAYSMGEVRISGIVEAVFKKKSG